MYVFVYGTLTQPKRVEQLVDSFVFVGPAVLDGLRPVDGTYPTLAPGGETPGRLLRTPEIDALDAYEGVHEGVYVRITVPLEGPVDASHGVPDPTAPGEGSGPTKESSGDRREAAVYVGDPDRLGVDVEWPGSGSFGDRVRQYVKTADVGVRVLSG